jgi:hypothetical protein
MAAVTLSHPAAVAAVLTVMAWKAVRAGPAALTAAATEV